MGFRSRTARSWSTFLRPVPVDLEFSDIMYMTEAGFVGSFDGSLLIVPMQNVKYAVVTQGPQEVIRNAKIIS
jgi:hypothetical protein